MTADNICPDCGHEPELGEWPFRCHGLKDGHNLRPRSSQCFDPVVVHQRKDGMFMFPGASDAPVLPGYQKVELKTFAEIDAFTRNVNRHERGLIERNVEREHQQIEASEAIHRPELRAAMQRMSPKDRALAQLAIDTNNRRRPKAFDPGVHLEIREMNSSNREPQRDRTTNWKPRR